MPASRALAAVEQCACPGRCLVTGSRTPELPSPALLHSYKERQTAFELPFGRSFPLQGKVAAPETADSVIFSAQVPRTSLDGLLRRCGNFSVVWVPVRLPLRQQLSSKPSAGSIKHVFKVSNFPPSLRASDVAAGVPSLGGMLGPYAASTPSSGSLERKTAPTALSLMDCLSSVPKRGFQDIVSAAEPWLRQDPCMECLLAESCASSCSRTPQPSRPKGHADLPG